MQNKRGISQAFSPAGTGGELLRRATLFDLFDMSRVLTRSIIQLCTAAVLVWGRRCVSGNIFSHTQ